MILLNITLKNFCQFPYDETFEFGATANRITADNNGGKTTIGHAIAYLLQGRDMDGSDKVDRLINDQLEGKRSMVVSGQIADNDGQILSITRSREISATNKTTNKLVVNGESWTQVKLDQAMGITDWRLFMATVFPTWIHHTDDKVAAEVLRSLIKPVSSEVVIKSLPTEQGDILAKIPPIKLADPAGYQSELRKEIKENESAITKARGRLEVYEKTCKQQLPEGPAVSPLDISGEIVKKRELIAAIESSAKKPVDTALLKREIERLRADYTRTRNSIREIPPAPVLDENAVCDKCGQHLGQESFAAVLEHHKAMAKQIEEANSAATERLNQIVKDAEKAKQELTKAEEQNKAINDGYDIVKVTKLREELAELETSLYQAQDLTRRRELAQTQIDEAVKAKEKDLKLVAEMEAEIPTWKGQIAALGAYLVERERLTMDQIAKHLDKTDIQLFKLVKETGELKPDFSITYDGQSYKGMSNSNRIRCGLEISELINSVTGWALPIYIDNAETITEFNEPSGQYIAAAVVGGAVLTVCPS